MGHSVDAELECQDKPCLFSRETQNLPVNNPFGSTEDLCKICLSHSSFNGDVLWELFEVSLNVSRRCISYSIFIDNGGQKLKNVKLMYTLKLDWNNTSDCH